MPLTPAPSSNRSEITLQPNYFTSSIYVKALRDDISSLIFAFHDAYSQPGPLKPFELFKNVWLKLGWNWLHFKVFDSRARQSFLDVTIRLFLERTVKREAPFTRVVALFGMYIFYYTQIKDTAPALHRITNVPISSDHYLALMTMPDTLTSPSNLPFLPHVRYIFSRLQKDQVFFIVPKSELGPLNPRELPREILIDEGMAGAAEHIQKRKGRPARLEKGKKARKALNHLESWVSEESMEVNEAEDEALGRYRELKEAVLVLTSEKKVKEVSERLVEALEEARSRSNLDGQSVEELKRTVARSSKGILGMI